MIMEKHENICIFHSGCPDGFGSAFIVWDFFRKYEENDKMEFYHGVHGQEPDYELLKDKTVYLVDFSYKTPVLLKIAEVAEQIIILDHHISAFNELVILKNDEKKWKGVNQFFLYEPKLRHKVTYYFAHKDYSGVGVVWNYFHGNELMPLLLQCIQDRDLWKWEIPNSNKILKGLGTYKQDFKIWDAVFRDDGSIGYLEEKGTAIIQHEKRQIDEIINNSCIMSTRNYGDISITNCPKTLTSEAGNLLAMDKQFSLLYYFKGRDMICSLRSIDGGQDVSLIALEFGGGGHARAAGFEIKNGSLSVLESIINS